MNRKTKIAILVMGYKRDEPLKTLLEALKKLVINDSDIPLIISIDGGGTEKIKALVGEYSWEHGEKKVYIHKEKMGLRNHFIWAGDQTQFYDNILFLEDDLLPSPYALEAALKICEQYEHNEQVAAASLYSPMICEFKDTSFDKLVDKSGLFTLQHPYWGTIWMKESWNRFKEWYRTYECKPEVLPSNVAKWRDGSSFKKVFIQYLIESKRTCLYPYSSFVTNMGEKGTNNYLSLYCFQTTLCIQEPEFRFCPIDEIEAKYDAFFEIDAEVLKKHNPELIKYDFAVDLKQVRECFDKPYVLTTRPVKKSIMSFSNKMKPTENAVLLNISGDGIYLARTEDVVFAKDERDIGIANDINCHYRITTMKVPSLLQKSLTKVYLSKLKNKFVHNK